MTEEQKDCLIQMYSDKLEQLKKENERLKNEIKFLTTLSATQLPSEDPSELWAIINDQQETIENRKRSLREMLTRNLKQAGWNVPEFTKTDLQAEKESVKE